MGRNATARYRIQALPVGLMVSLTWNRGYELVAHKKLTVATQVQLLDLIVCTRRVACGAADTRC